MTIHYSCTGCGFTVTSDTKVNDIPCMQCGRNQWLASAVSSSRDPNQCFYCGAYQWCSCATRQPPLKFDPSNKHETHVALAKQCYDKIERPAHYTEGRKFETIEVIEDLGLTKGFCLGNALKYISRAGKKEGSSELEDLKKARWYLNRWITSLEAQQKTEPDPCSAPSQ